MLSEGSRVLSERSRVLSERSRVFSERSRVLSDGSRVLSEHSRGERTFTIYQNSSNDYHSYILQENAIIHNYLL
jgi:hypothetical protein